MASGRALILAMLFGLIATILLPPPALAAASDEFAALLEDRDEDFLRRHPSLAIARGDRRYLDRFEENLTGEFLAESQRLNDGYAARLDAIDRALLSEEDRISYDVLRWEFEIAEAYLSGPAAEMSQLIPLHQMGGAHLDFAREMQWSSIYPFNTAEDYERAIRRMGGFARWIDQAILRMREGVARGVTLPRILVEKVIAQVTPLADPDLDNSDFLGPVTNMPETITGPDRERLSEAYRRAIEETVVPAYARLAAFLSDTYLGQARETIGLSDLPGGRDFYLLLIRDQTTTEMTPEEIHALGLSEIARIESEMERVKTEAGFDGTLAAFKDFMGTDPRFRFSDSDAMLEEFERAKGTVDENLLTLFETSPASELEFRFVPDYAAPASAAAFYTAPAAEARRPGLIYLNTHDLPLRLSYTADALYLHEGIPGHHLQLSLSIEHEALPAMRRFGGPTAFVEGWGLYSESLGKNLGLYADPYREFGGLSFDAWRAARLVIDTGIHWFGWTREQGIEFLLAHPALTETEAIAEVERYIAMPGQALAYKIGQQKFFELRDRAREELGEDFDIRRFHTALLDGGALPLPILEAKIERWIDAEQPQ